MALRRIIGYSVRRAQHKFRRSVNSMFDMFDQYFGPHGGHHSLAVQNISGAFKKSNIHSIDYLDPKSRSILLAGHSHWENIKHKKARTDSARASKFQKLSLEITTAVKQGGADLQSNLRLALLIQKAKEINFPKDRVEAAIQRGSGKGSDSAEPIIYEGYGPQGTAIVIETLTDNRNRTAQLIRKIFSDYSCNLGATGCVSYMFSKLGQIIVPMNGKSEDEITEIALEAGAEDIKFPAPGEKPEAKILCKVDALFETKKVLESKGIGPKQMTIVQLPQSIVTFANEENLKLFQDFLIAFENCEDVVTVTHNADLKAEDDE
jgi:YebC/PmpR family DNA-binding regulatory protein